MFAGVSARVTSPRRTSVPPPPLGDVLQVLNRRLPSCSCIEEKTLSIRIRRSMLYHKAVSLDIYYRLTILFSFFFGFWLDGKDGRTSWALYPALHSTRSAVRYLIVYSSQFSNRIQLFQAVVFHRGRWGGVWLYRLKIKDYETPKEWRTKKNTASTVCHRSKCFYFSSLSSNGIYEIRRSSTGSAFTFRLFRIHNVNHYNNQHVGNHGDKSQRTIVASAFLRTLAIV